MNDIEYTLDEQARLLSRAVGGRIESRKLPDGTYQHTAKAERMEWTTEFPTKPGDYWIRNYLWKSPGEGPNLRTCLTTVFPDPSFPGLVFSFIPGDGAFFAFECLASAEWQGPIQPQD